MPIPITTWGASGDRLPRIGLGLAALGRPQYHNLAHGDDLDGRASKGRLQQHTHLMLDAAWTAGVRYFDTARSYGLGEAFLAAWLEERAVKPVVGSKWGYTYVANWNPNAIVHEVKDHSVDTLRRQWPETEALLGDAVQVYYVHSATADSGVFSPEVLKELRRIRDAKGIAMGLSVTGPQQAHTLRAAMDHAGDLFSRVQATFNVLEPSVGPALQEAADAGWGIVIKEGVANGRLTHRSDLPDVRQVMQTQAQRLHTTPDALALAWILTHPFAHVVLSGAATEAHLRSNLAASDVRLDEEARLALAQLVMAPDAYWTLRKGLPWT